MAPLDRYIEQLEQPQTDLCLVNISNIHSIHSTTNTTRGLSKQYDSHQSRMHM